MEFERFDMTIPPVRTRWYLRPLTIIVSTRGVVIIETDEGGLVAVIPVGMCQVSSVNFEGTIVPGARVEKGDPLGYFLFGGSDIVMLFSKDLDFEFTAEKDEHLLMGQEYERLGTK